MTGRRVAEQTPVVAFEHVDVTFRARGGTTDAVRDVDLAVHANEFVCIIGPSGCGKTTLLRPTDYFHVTEITYPYGMDAALVEVDPETGLVRILKYVIAADVGRALNPLIADGQTVGGMAQGVGAALLEELVYDADGQLLTTSFMDYLLPTAAEMPETVVLRHQGGHPSRHNPLGAKGAGEGGILAAPATLANAVEGALRPLRVTVDRLPLSPDRVLALVRDARRRA